MYDQSKYYYMKCKHQTSLFLFYFLLFDFVLLNIIRSSLAAILSVRLISVIVSNHTIYTVVHFYDD